MVKKCKNVFLMYDEIKRQVEEWMPEKFEFIHEVLGHGTLAYREETDDSLVVFDCTNYLKNSLIFVLYLKHLVLIL